MMRFSHKRGYLDHDAYVAQCFALAVFTMGVVKTIGSDDLLAVFFAGTLFSFFDLLFDRIHHLSGHVVAQQDDEFQTQIEGESFNAVVGYILSCACFFYIGAWLPWDGFSMPQVGITPWRLVVLCSGILGLRRIPAVLMLYKWIPEIENWKEALFCGHFGVCCFWFEMVFFLEKKIFRTGEC